MLDAGRRFATESCNDTKQQTHSFHGSARPPNKSGKTNQNPTVTCRTCFGVGENLFLGRSNPSQELSTATGELVWGAAHRSQTNPNTGTRASWAKATRAPSPHISARYATCTGLGKSWSTVGWRPVGCSLALRKSRQHTAAANPQNFTAFQFLLHCPKWDDLFWFSLPCPLLGRHERKQ